VNTKKKKKQSFEEGRFNLIKEFNKAVSGLTQSQKPKEFLILKRNKWK